MAASGSLRRFMKDIKTLDLDRWWIDGLEGWTFSAEAMVTSNHAPGRATNANVRWQEWRKRCLN